MTDAALRHSSGDRAGIARCGWHYRGFVDRNRLSHPPSCRSVQLSYRRKEKAIGHICEFAREIPISGHLLACCRPEPNRRGLLPYFDLLRVEISLKRLRKPRRAGKRSRLRLMRSLEGQRQRSLHFNDEYQPPIGCHGTGQFRLAAAVKLRSTALLTSSFLGRMPYRVDRSDASCTSLMTFSSIAIGLVRCAV
jgi:hypothetical protein